MDIFEDFALALARRMHAIEPCASMDGVERHSLALAIDCCADRRVKDFSGVARMHATCTCDLCP